MKTKVYLLCFLVFMFSFMFGEVLFSVEIEQKLIEMTFETDAQDWRAERSCKVTFNSQDKLLTVQAIDGSPHLSRFFDILGGQIRIVAEIRTSAESSVSTFWTTQGSPRRSDDKMTTQPLIPDSAWHSYEFILPIPDRLTSFTLRFNTSEGTWDIKSFNIYRHRIHPLTVKQIVPYLPPEGKEQTSKMLRCTVYNDVPVPLVFHIGNQPEEFRIPGLQSIDLGVPVKEAGNLAAAHLQLLPNEFPEINFSFFLYHPEGKTDWMTKPLGLNNDAKTLEIAPNAQMARIRQGKNVFAIIAPIVHRNGVIPAFQLASDSTEALLHFQAPDTELKIQVGNDSLRFLIEDKTAPNPLPLEGPVVRIFGKLQSGLLAGVEFLGQGDVSSSSIDIEPPYNDRSEPNPLWLTMPLAVLGTDKGAAMLRWNDPKLQPRFASPNSFDHSDDHRMSLIGSKIEATLEFLTEVGAAHKVREISGETAVIQALRHYIDEEGFPEPPAAPRSAEEQRLLCIRALDGMLQKEYDLLWGYAAEADWQRQPFADILSTLVRLTEADPDAPQPRPTKIVPGGADIANDAIYFLTERIEEWRASRETAIQSLLTLRNPDGSFLHRTHFPEVESSATSFGYTAIRTLEIMEYVRLVGNRELFEKVRQSLDYLKRCDVPRGGFYRDTPIHTPDLATAATFVWLFTWAFEFTGNAEYLELAKRFAFAGLPFVYQWKSERNNGGIAPYTTVSKFGATRRQMPLGFGVSQTRVGIVYAYALNLLAKHDSSVNWKRPAVGILHTAENIQYADGEYAGCVPDMFDAVTQLRSSWKVNPCALVSLRLAVEGKTDSLFVLTDKNGEDRYVSPYPLRLTPKGIEAFDVPPKRKFQILHNGSRIGNAEGSGRITMD